MKQADAVLEWMREHDGITSWEAFAELGVTRLSAAIYNLRKRGLEIETQTLKTKNRYGSTVAYAKYVLEEDSK